VSLRFRTSGISYQNRRFPPGASLFRRSLDKHRCRPDLLRTRRPDPDLETEARRIAEAHIADWALERGILEKSEQNGKLYLENFLLSLGFENVQIQIREQ